MKDFFVNDIKEKYGSFGIEIAYCFEYIAEYFGYDIVDLSNFRSALNTIEESEEKPLKENDIKNIDNILDYIQYKYPIIHTILINNADKRDAFPQEEVIIKFRDHLTKNIMDRKGSTYWKSIESILFQEVKNCLFNISKTIDYNSSIIDMIYKIDKSKYIPDI
jgi:hypothetical protein